MIDPRVHELLSEPLGVDPSGPVNDAEVELLRYLAVAALVFKPTAERYKALSARFDDDGPSPGLRADALDAAGDLAAVLQAVHRRHERCGVLDDRTGLSPLAMLGGLDEVFNSLMLMTELDPEDDFFSSTRLAPEMVDDLLSFDEFDDYLDPDTAIGWLRLAG